MRILTSQHERRGKLCSLRIQSPLQGLNHGGARCAEEHAGRDGHTMAPVHPEFEMPAWIWSSTRWDPTLWAICHAILIVP